MLNVNLSYKPPSSWRILSRPGGCPRQFSCQKLFRSLTDPGGAYRKGVILQGRRLFSGLPVLFKSCLIIIVYIMVADVYAPRQRNSPFGQTSRQYIYRTILPEQPHSTIHQWEQFPQVPVSLTCYRLNPILKCCIGWSISMIYPDVDIQRLLLTSIIMINGLIVVHMEGKSNILKTLIQVVICLLFWVHYHNITETFFVNKQLRKYNEIFYL